MRTMHDMEGQAVMINGASDWLDVGLAVASAGAALIQSPIDVRREPPGGETGGHG